MLMIVAAWASSFVRLSPAPHRYPQVAAVALDDLKFARTVSRFVIDRPGGEPALLLPIDRPGMHFAFAMSPMTHQRLRAARGGETRLKEQWQDATLSIDGGPELVILIRIHGQGSTLVDRKSFLVHFL